MFWGVTRALDLQHVLYTNQPKRVGDNLIPDELPERTPLNILLIGTSDARHVIKTLAKSYTHSKRHIRFFVYELHLEVLARQMLLLSVVLEPPEKLGLLEKTRIFMELYGNAFLRASTASYLSKKCNHLIRMITDEEHMKKVLPLFDFSHLKYRDRDRLEDIFKFWRSLDSSFDMTDLWDKRLRNMLGSRYDSREGVFDWDYYMVLKDRGSEYINFQEYKQFRTNGVGFTWLETEYAISNPTLAAYVIRMEGKLRHHGYIGDVVSGPFYAFGMETDQTDMNRKSNGVYMKKATDISERNLMQYFHELQNKSPYVHVPVKGETNSGVVITEITSAPLVSEDDKDKKVTKIPVSNASAEEHETISVENGTVIFLTSPEKVDCLQKREFKELFDIIVVSQNMTHVLSKEILSVASKDATVIIESRKYLLSLTKDHLKEYSDTLEEKAQLCNFEKIHNFDPKSDEYAFFRMRHPCEE
ncbi:dynein axonemal assembly factor 3 [Schistocerca nitens]|uniref:dynein axonemal assembly factor 3 n=1 Tax=Schistocerca nitens TaxID=7011 RepID=UPI00211945A3|nr:dynein axonemal assembly factor 3 [Schistocerca nitens]XP_049803438.1 dynein axonemal assembly factor 3 [Schistocerca nitens]